MLTLFWLSIRFEKCKINNYSVELSRQLLKNVRQTTVLANGIFLKSNYEIKKFKENQLDLVFHHDLYIVRDVSKVF